MAMEVLKESWNGGAPIEGKPIQLIKIDENGKMTIQNSALDIIKNLKGSLAVCSIVGPYRSGKSYILNLMLNRPNGFNLGATNESCTRGIWMWDRPIEITNNHGTLNVILMDTEGLGSYDRSPDSDNRIFVLSLLLSSLFIYNTMGVIDRGAINKLGVMNDLAKCIDNKSSNQQVTNRNQTEHDSKLMKANLPHFVWAVRDYFLQNNFESANHYLERALSLEDSEHRVSQEANLIRNAIRNSFRALHCYLIPAPIDNGLNGKSRDETLQHLENVDWKHLNPKFRSSITDLCKHIREEMVPKSLFGTQVSAPAFSQYIKTVVEQLNNNERVNMMDSLASGIRFASEKSLADAIAMFEKKLAFQKLLSPSIRWSYFNQINHQELFDGCFQILKVDLNGDNEITWSYLDRFVKLKEEKLKQLRDYNKLSIKTDLKRKLDELWNKHMRCYFDNTEHRTENVGKDFIESKDLVKMEYERYSLRKFGGKYECVEIEEVYNDWYRDRNIENLIKSFKQIEEEIRNIEERKIERMLRKLLKIKEF